jgi:serine/threonine protein kinase
VGQLEADDPSHIGRFRLLSRLGEGGMGRVYLGASPGNRKVAIKVVHPRHASDPEFRRRFSHEVAAARRVGGFHTAAVVAADPDANPPWMATAYIPGPSLDDAIGQNGPLGETGLRELGAALAEGLSAIHACDIIHRDLKPGNIILAEDGPRIIDFGIAKTADANTSLTASNVVIGTLRYMSPEQLDGQPLTPQSDIFSLGAILAYAGTGHFPFGGSTILAIVAQILNHQPNLDPLTGDLRDVISDCLAREPSDRPSLAELLDRFTTPKAASGLPANGAATPVPPAPLPAGPSPANAKQPTRATVRMSSYVNTIISGPNTRPPAPPPAPPAQVAHTPIREPWYRRYRRLLVMAIAGAVAVAGVAAGLAVFVFNKHPPTVSSATGSVAATLSGPTSLAASSVAFGPDGTLAIGDRLGRTYLWNTATRKPGATLTAPSHEGVFSVAFGPGGILATGGNNGRTDLWNTRTGKHAGTFSDTSRQVVPSVAFGPGGILATAQVKSIDIWNTATGNRTAVLTDPGSAGVFSVAFGPGGILAAGDDNGRTYLWNTSTKEIVATLADPASTGVNSVAFGPDGILAAGDDNLHTYLWNTSTKEIVATLADPASTGVNSVAFGPDGILAVGDKNGHTYLWNTSTKEIVATLADPASTGVDLVAFGPGGTVLATGDHNGRTYVWNITYHKT